MYAKNIYTEKVLAKPLQKMVQFLGHMVVMCRFECKPIIWLVASEAVL